MKMTILGLLVLSSAACGTSSSSPAAPSVQMFTLAAAVRTLDGAPLSGALVSINGAVTGQTGADGSYRVRLTAGDYTIAASADGFEPAARSVYLTADTIVDLALSRPCAHTATTHTYATWLDHERALLRCQLPR